MAKKVPIEPKNKPSSELSRLVLAKTDTGDAARKSTTGKRQPRKKSFEKEIEELVARGKKAGRLD
ncbi:hypothetical protein BVY00_01960, partial [bacterium G20]